MALITELDDRTLVEQHRAGDDDAFRTIVVRHHRSLYANALRRLGDPVLAEDAVQETFLRAFRAIDRFDGDYHLDAWLHRIATNACHDIGRRQGRDNRLFDRACTVASDTVAPPADEALNATPRDELTRAFDSLPESYREVLLLRFVDEMSYSDVALKAGISEQNARARVSRGRTMLKGLLSSASGLLVWAMAPLRRGTDTVDADIAAQNLANATNIASVAAPVAQSAPAVSQASIFAAQLGPTIAQVAPVVSSSGPSLGKAAVAVGIAVTVAIPTGVAIEKRMNTPPPVAAPANDDAQSTDPGASVQIVETAAPTTIAAAAPVTPTTQAVASTVGPLATGEAEILSGADTSTSTTEAPAQTTTTVVPTQDTTTTAPPPADGGGTDGSTDEPVAEETPPPAPPPSGELATRTLTVTEEGPRLALRGDISITVGDRTMAGTLDGKILVGDADPKNPQAPREIEAGGITLSWADGTTTTLRLRGTAVVSEQGNKTIHDLSVNFGLDGASALGLAESGQLTGNLTTGNGGGSLTLTIPGAPADENS